MRFETLEFFPVKKASSDRAKIQCVSLKWLNGIFDVGPHANMELGILCKSKALWSHLKGNEETPNPVADD